MKTRILRDLKVSAIGMGFTHAYGDGPSEEEGIRLVHKAYELGCNFFDTAEMYSYFKNEEFPQKSVLLMTADGGDHSQAVTWYRTYERNLRWKNLGEVLGKGRTKEAYQLGASI